MPASVVASGERIGTVVCDDLEAVVSFNDVGA